MALLIGLIVIGLLIAASVFATDSRDGRDWSATERSGLRVPGGPRPQCCG